MNAIQSDEIKSFQPSFHSRNSIVDNFDKKFEMLKSLGSINSFEKEDYTSKAQSVLNH